MAMGNISGASTAMATKAQMVGFVPRDSVKEVKKEEEHTTTIRELEQQDTSNTGARTGQDPRDAQGKGQVQTPDQKVRQRQISAPQQERSRPAEESTESAESRPTPDPSTSPQTHAPRGRVAFDTSAQIQWKFNQAQTGQTGAAENGQSSPEVQKRQFLRRLQDMVKIEYQQYVKSDDAVYSRRNLREIAAALNQEDPYSKRLGKEQDSRNNNSTAHELEGYNKFNAMRATRSLQVVQHQQQEQQQEPALQLVA